MEIPSLCAQRLDDAQRLAGAESLALAPVAVFVLGEQVPSLAEQCCRGVRWHRATVARGGGGGLPGVDAGALAPAALAALGGRDGGEAGEDPAAGVGGVDDAVDLDVGRGVDRLALLVVAGEHAVVEGAALGGIGDGFELLAKAELDRAL